MEEKVLEETDVEGIIGLLESKDNESISMGYMILENCNIALSVCWILIIYKKISKERRETFPNFCPILWRFLSLIFSREEPHPKINSQECYEVLQACANNEGAIAYLEREFAEGMRLKFIDWDYPFLKNYTITLTKNDNS